MKHCKKKLRQPELAECEDPKVKLILPTSGPEQIAFYRTFYLVLILLNADQSTSFLSFLLNDAATVYFSIFSFVTYILRSHLAEMSTYIVQTSQTTTMSSL